MTDDGCYKSGSRMTIAAVLIWRLDLACPQPPIILPVALHAHRHRMGPHLRAQGVDILSGREEGWGNLTDSEILAQAHALARFVLPHDADFGDLCSTPKICCAPHIWGVGHKTPVPTRDWFLNVQILTSGGFRGVVTPLTTKSDGIAGRQLTPAAQGSSLAASSRAPQGALDRSPHVATHTLTRVALDARRRRQSSPPPPPRPRA
jgi:uncharacterized protein DUF5615